MHMHKMGVHWGRGQKTDNENDVDHNNDEDYDDDDDTAQTILYTILSVTNHIQRS